MKKWIPAAATAAVACLFAIAPRLSERSERMPKVYYAHRQKGMPEFLSALFFYFILRNRGRTFYISSLY